MRRQNPTQDTIYDLASQQNLMCMRESILSVMRIGRMWNTITMSSDYLTSTEVATFRGGKLYMIDYLPLNVGCWS